MTDLQRLEAKIDRMDRTLRALLGEQKKKTWVKACDIKKLTGWGHNKMRLMRETRVVEWKKDGGFFYNLESVPQQFIKSAL